MNISLLSSITLSAIMMLHSAMAATGDASSPSQVSVPPGRVVISGTVPDEASKAALLARLQEIYGAGQVIDQIGVGGVVAPPNWSANASKLITQRLKSISKGKLVLEGTTVSIRGEVNSETLRKAIANDFAAALNPNYVVKNGLRVTADDQSLVDRALANRVVEFEPGSAMLTESGKEILNEMAEALKKLETKKIEIIGHTDNIGAPARNTSLSRSRAESVKTYLVAHGISSQALNTSGMGADQPIVSNTTEEGRRRNRRIEFRVSQ
ncbi:OmpA family protein [Noviherbaspirillum sp.]|uniref:OmpA family protein n=1 Tax=Noviherbaspirillum sp. TaxID=1926288 RepID=UPI002B4A4032|nr:OmpA family protein [Noviherbaspirillum sp.]HJV82749.1 OmpA family protein [Noviherbaspirillum sp.]